MFSDPNSDQCISQKNNKNQIVFAFQEKTFSSISGVEKTGQPHEKE